MATASTSKLNDENINQSKTNSEQQRCHHHRHCSQHHGTSDYHCHHTEAAASAKETSIFRPGASKGLWLPALLPAACAAVWLQDSTDQHASRALAILALQSCLSCFYLANNTTARDVSSVSRGEAEQQPSHIVILWCALFTIVSLHWFTETGLVMCGLVGVVNLVVQAMVTRWLLYNHGTTFSQGEWLMAGQCVSLSVSSSLHGLLSACPRTTAFPACQLATFLQLAVLLSSCLLLMVLSLAPRHRGPALLPLTAVLGGVGVLWGSLLLGEFVPSWLLQQLVGSTAPGGGHGWVRVLLLAWWSLLTVVAWASTRWVQRYQGVSVSLVRKVYHVVAVLVYLAGVLLDPALLSLATVAATILCTLLEVVRILELPPLAGALTAAFSHFLDEKDRSGTLILSPIYLLVGLSLPLWLHTLPPSYGAAGSSSSNASWGAEAGGASGCDAGAGAGDGVTAAGATAAAAADAACLCYPDHTLAMLSGVLAVGVGDTFASVCGVLWGRYRWPGSRKTVLGSLCGVLAQLLLLAVLVLTGAVVAGGAEGAWLWWWAGVTATMVVCALVEAFTDQVDNLVLPLVMLLGLTLTQRYT